MAKQLCKCLEKNKITSIEDIEPCLEQVFVKNIEGLYKYYNIQTMDEMDSDKVWYEIGAHLSKDCDYFIPYVTDPINKIEKDFVPEKNLDCSQLKNGEFYYYFPNSYTKVNDTTFVSITDKMFLERMNNGKTYSLLDIEWKDECKFNLIYQQSNDPYKSVLSKKKRCLRIRNDWKHTQFIYHQNKME